MKEYKKTSQVTVKEFINILSDVDTEAIIINGEEKNIKVYVGRENKKDGKQIVMIC